MRMSNSMAVWEVSRAPVTGTRNSLREPVTAPAPSARGQAGQPRSLGSTASPAGRVRSLRNYSVACEEAGGNVVFARIPKLISG